MLSLLKHYWFALLITVAALVLTPMWLGLSSIVALVILIIIEVTFSFDNAVVNAKILDKMSRLWQFLFLSVGIIIAVFAMRLVFPILIVALTADLSWHSVIDLALNQPDAYAAKLDEAHPMITAFGGAFLLMLSLHFFTGENKHYWLRPVESRLAQAGAWWLPSLVTLLVLAVITLLLNQHASEVAEAGLVGVVTYLLIHGLTVGLERSSQSVSQAKHYTGWLAFVMFMYLQVLDASFSLDGVLGAFAITTDVVLIAVGLGVGAFWVRSMTVQLVRQGTLKAYRYLEHGAYWAIFVLAFSMLVSSLVEIPSVIVGLAGVSCIVAALVSSIRASRAEAAA